MENKNSKILAMTENLLRAWCEQELPDGFENSGVKICINDAGYVFLLNDFYDIAALNVNKLEILYFCSKCGRQGFKNEIAKNADYCDGCKEI